MSPIQHCLTGLVTLYRWTLSPAKTFLFGPFSHCRFTPSCSAYALEAVELHGSAAGSWLALKRICRCHPWGGCGHDPVPIAPGSGRAEESGARVQGIQAMSLTLCAYPEAGAKTEGNG
jgi:uncharacterized protein